MALRYSSLLAALLLFALPYLAYGQVTIRGQVTDAETGTPLPQASLQIEGTYQGTITNSQGRYSLTIHQVPATVRVRYIGYETTHLTVTNGSPSHLDVALEPSTVEMEEVVVTGSKNPGRDIMRKVIEQKQTWWDSLETYQVNAYSRYTLSNDTGIVSMYETQTRAYWDRSRGMREVVQTRRQTENLGMFTGVMPAASAVLNLYQDNIDLMGASLMGVTHPDALDRYAFTLDTVRVLDGRKVYDIRVEPKSRLTSAFVGSVAVLDSAFAMIEAKLRPAASLRMPRIVESRSMSFEQQFSNYGRRYWLPVDFRADVQFSLSLSSIIKIPPVHVYQVARLSGYELNVPVPDSLYRPESDQVVAANEVDPAFPGSLSVDSLDQDGPYVPLSMEEERAYARADSTMTLEKAFPPGGLVGAMMDFGGDGEPDSASDTSAQQSETNTALDLNWPWPVLRYNRVEGPHVGARMSAGIGEFVDIDVRGGRSFFLDGGRRWSYGASAASELPTDVLDDLEVSYRYGVEPRYESRVRLFPPIARAVNSLWTLVGEADYFDYFGVERLRFGLSMSLPIPDTDARLQFRSERHFSVTDVHHYNVLGREGFYGRNTFQPANPAIDEGRMRSLQLRATWGDDGRLRGILPLNRVEANVEHSGDWLFSDFGFTRGEVAVDTRVETFFRRRLLPMTLDLRATAGGSLGTLPLQRFGVVEASPLPYTPFGALRTLDDRPYQGTEHVALFWEHNLRTIPFEWLGLDRVVDRHIELILHGGHARSWIDDRRERRFSQQDIGLEVSDGSHHEVGLSVNGLDDLFRVDLTTRIDEPVVSVGVSLLRFL